MSESNAIDKRDYEQACKDRQQLISISDLRGAEIVQLRNALANAMHIALHHGYTRSRFAQMINVTEAQLLRWIDSQEIPEARLKEPVEVASTGQKETEQ